MHLNWPLFMRRAATRIGGKGELQNTQYGSKRSGCAG